MKEWECNNCDEGCILKALDNVPVDKPIFCPWSTHKDADWKDKT